MLSTKETRAELLRLAVVERPSADTARELADAVPMLLEDVEELLETVERLEHAAGERDVAAENNVAWEPSSYTHAGCGGSVQFQERGARDGTQCRCLKCGKTWCVGGRWTR